MSDRDFREVSPLKRFRPQEEPDDEDSIGEMSSTSIAKAPSSLADALRRESFSSILSLNTRNQFKTAIKNLKESLPEELLEKMDSPPDFSPNAPPQGYEESPFNPQGEQIPETKASGQYSPESSVDSSGFEKVERDVLEEYGQHYARQIHDAVFGELKDDPEGEVDGFLLVGTSSIPPNNMSSNNDITEVLQRTPTDLDQQVTVGNNFAPKEEKKTPDSKLMSSSQAHKHDDDLIEIPHKHDDDLIEIPHKHDDDLIEIPHKHDDDLIEIPHNHSEPQEHSGAAGHLDEDVTDIMGKHHVDVNPFEPVHRSPSPPRHSESPLIPNLVPESPKKAESPIQEPHHDVRPEPVHEVPHIQDSPVHEHHEHYEPVEHHVHHESHPQEPYGIPHHHVEDIPEQFEDKKDDLLDDLESWEKNDDVYGLKEKLPEPEHHHHHHEAAAPEEFEDQPDFRSQTPEEVPYHRTGPLTIPEMPEIPDVVAPHYENLVDFDEKEDELPPTPKHHGFETEPRPPTPPKDISEEDYKPSLVNLGHGTHAHHHADPHHSILKHSSSGQPWIDFKAVDPKLLELIYWRDVKKSAITLSLTLIVIFIFAKYPILSVLAYAGLAVLAATLGFRIFKVVEGQIKKTGGENPFQEYLAQDLSLPQERVHAQVDVLVEHGTCVANHIKKVVFVENIVESVKFGLLLWALTYVASWFSGVCLVVLTVLSVFSVPKVYETYQEPIDAQLAVVMGHINNVTQLLEEKLPFLKKAEVVEKKDQ